MDSETAPIDMDSVVGFDDLDPNDELDTHFLGLYGENESDLTESGWTVHERYFGLGIPELVAVYLLRVTPAPPEDGDWVWFVVSANVGNGILNASAGSHPLEALDTYLAMMESVAEDSLDGSVDAEEPQMDKERAGLALETIYEIREVIAGEADEEE